MADMPPVLPNLLKRRLAAGEPAYVMTFMMARSVDAVGIAAATGHHGFYVDLQHSAHGVDDAVQLCCAGLYAGLTPLVRVPTADPGLIGRLMAGGAQGVIVPDVRDADMARTAVRAALVPPMGDRSALPVGAATGWRSVPRGEFERLQNEATLLILMLESPEAIANAGEIAAIPGVDALFIGSNDLTTAMGIPGQFADERLRGAYRTAIAAARAHGKPVMVGGIKEPRLLASYIAMGAARCYFTGNDTAFLLDGAKRQMEALRAADAALGG